MHQLGDLVPACSKGGDCGSHKSYATHLVLEESTETQLGKTQEEAVAMPKGPGLVRATVEEAQGADVLTAIVTTVIRQDRIQESRITKGGTVHITIAAKAEA
jgi:hypothetical protein